MTAASAHGGSIADHAALGIACFTTTRISYPRYQGTLTDASRNELEPIASNAGPIMSRLDMIAPPFSRRRTFLSILRAFRYRPASIFGRLAPINFRNARLCANLQIRCNVCGHEGHMVYDYPDVHIRRRHGIGLLRETLRCRHCRATMRDRQMAYGLLQAFSTRLGQTWKCLRDLCQSPQGALRILDTDSFSPLNRELRRLPGYAHSQYRPDLPNGAVLADRSINVNLLDIPYDAASFDIIMTSDVMEHVADDAQAHREIHRCLAPQGTYIFTVPFDPCLFGTRRLTQPTGQADLYFVLDEQIHGDPLSNKGIIAHRIYGEQLLHDLAGIGFAARFVDINVPESGIFGGDLFLASKGVA
jgi:hypothetical protein